MSILDVALPALMLMAAHIMNTPKFKQESMLPVQSEATAHSAARSTEEVELAPGRWRGRPLGMGAWQKEETHGDTWRGSYIQLCSSAEGRSSTPGTVSSEMSQLTSKRIGCTTLMNARNISFVVTRDRQRFNQQLPCEEAECT